MDIGSILVATAVSSIVTSLSKPIADVIQWLVDYVKTIPFRKQPNSMIFEYKQINSLKSGMKSRIGEMTAYKSIAHVSNKLVELGLVKLVKFDYSTGGIPCQTGDESCDTMEEYIEDYKRGSKINLISKDKKVKYNGMEFYFFHSVVSKECEVTVSDVMIISSREKSCADIAEWLKEIIAESEYGSYLKNKKSPSIIYMKSDLDGYDVPQDKTCLEWSAYPMKECDILRERCLNLGDSKMFVLLHGIPGTGKSSLIKTLAKTTNRHIVNVNLEKIGNVDNLRMLLFGTPLTLGKIKQFNNNPRHTIYLFEEIDSYFRKEISQDETEEKKPVSEEELMGVLNGVSNPEGAIVVFTTNFVDLLDRSRMFRAGRIDFDIEMRKFTQAEVAVRLLLAKIYVRDINPDWLVPAELERVINNWKY